MDPRSSLVAIDSMQTATAEAQAVAKAGMDWASEGGYFTII